MVSVLTKSREKQFLENGKSGHWNLEKSMKIKKIVIVLRKYLLSVEKYPFRNTVEAYHTT